MNALMTCTSDDLKEAGLPEEASQRVLKFIQHKKRATTAVKSLSFQIPTANLLLAGSPRPPYFFRGVFMALKSISERP